MICPGDVDILMTAYRSAAGVECGMQQPVIFRSSLLCSCELADVQRPESKSGVTRLKECSVEKWNCVGRGGVCLLALSESENVLNCGVYGTHKPGDVEICDFV